MLPKVVAARDGGRGDGGGGEGGGEGGGGEGGILLSCLLSCGFIENSTMRRPILVSSLWSLSAERQRVELLKRADERRLGAGCGSTKVEVDEVFDAEGDLSM